MELGSNVLMPQLVTKQALNDVFKSDTVTPYQIDYQEGFQKPARRLSFFDVVIIILIVFTIITLYNRYKRYKRHVITEHNYKGLLNLFLDYLTDDHAYYPHHLDGIENDFNY